MFFVLTTGRSGSTTMARVMSHVPGCVCLHEPEPALICEAPRYRYGEVGSEEMRAFISSTRSTLMKGKKIYGESNQNLSLVMPELFNVFPDAKYIWLLRNGLDVVGSMSTRGDYRKEKPPNYDELAPDNKQWHDCRIQGDLCGSVSEEQWKKMDTFERCCWYWSYVNRTIKSDFESLQKDGYYLLRLEHLSSNIMPLCKWLGASVILPLPLGIYNAAKVDNYSPYNWREWSHQEREMFEHWCGALMDEYYPEWRTGNGEWAGVKYESPSWLQNLTSRHQNTTKRINTVYSNIFTTHPD